MDNIQIVSENIYTLNVVKKLTQTLKSRHISHAASAIFIFERKWLDEKDVMNLVQCNARRILVFARPDLHFFIMSVTQHNRITCVDLGTSVEEITTLLEQFLNFIPRISFSMLHNRDSFISLTRSERRIIELILSGEPVCYISERMNLGCKTIYTHKRSAMSKMQLTNDAALVHMGKMYLLLEADRGTSEKSSPVAPGIVNQPLMPALVNI